MNRIFLNELSLEGQFNDLDEFLNASFPLMKCLKFIRDHKGAVDKYSGFYGRKITKDKTWNDLRGIRGDRVRRIKSLLLSTTDSPPFWDLEEETAQNLEKSYRWNGKDISGTSIAEAAELNSMLLSFPHRDFNDVSLKIVKEQTESLEVCSAVSYEYMIENLWKKRAIDIYDYLAEKYEGTRLNFSRFEREYGFSDFEKEEIRDCLQAFHKFVKLESWEEIFKDQSLRCKRYSPSSKEADWFHGEKYQDKIFYKFRCINPKRCFGYREGDVFYALRMERDHKISDNG